MVSGVLLLMWVFLCGYILTIQLTGSQFIKILF